MNIKDLRVVKTRASINKAFITLFSKKILTQFQLKKLQNMLKLGENILSPLY